MRPKDLVKLKKTFSQKKKAQVAGTSSKKMRSMDAGPAEAPIKQASEVAAKVILEPAALLSLLALSSTLVS